MNAIDIDVSRLNRSEKIALMERLWAELPTDELQPPERHKDILAARSGEWENRNEVSMDWADAKAAMRRDLL
jgi:hypothetical protein